MLKDSPLRDDAEHIENGSRGINSIMTIPAKKIRGSAAEAHVKKEANANLKGQKESKAHIKAPIQEKVSLAKAK